MSRQKTTVKEKISKIKFDLQKIESLASLGMTDVQIASVLGITEMTLNRWKKDESFMLALKKGKDFADSKVIESLYRRATGYDHTDIYFSSYQGVVTSTPYMKHFIPDVTAQIFWLKNRQPENWREKQDVDITSGGKSFEGVIVTIRKNEQKST